MLLWCIDYCNFKQHLTYTSVWRLVWHSRHPFRQPLFQWQFYVSFKDSNVLENNMVKHRLSSSRYFVRNYLYLARSTPCLVLNGFPFWQTFFACACGGSLGVLFTHSIASCHGSKESDLPYPEGQVAAEILKVGSQWAHRSQRALVWAISYPVVL